MASNLTRLTKIGVAKETNWGTSVTTSMLFPITSFDSTHNIPDIIDEGIRGVPAMDFTAVQGGIQGEVEVEGWFYSNEFGLMLLAQMGAVASTALDAGTSPAEHNYTLAASPPSLTIHEQRDALTGYDWAGMLNTNLTIQFNRNDGALTYSASFMGKGGVAATDDTLTETATDAFSGWEATMSAGGGAVANVMSFEMNMERNGTLVFSGNNTQQPSTGYLGPQRVTGRMVVNYTADSEIDKFLDKTQEDVRFIFTNGASTDAERSLTAVIPTFDYGASPVVINRDADHLTLEYSWRALYSVSDTGNVTFSLKNETDSY